MLASAARKVFGVGTAGGLSSRLAPPALVPTLGQGSSSSILGRQRPSCDAAASSHSLLKLQTRGYRHWWYCTPDEFELPAHSMPLDIKDIMKNPNAREFDFLDHYWYWRVRKEATILNPERLVKLSYKQLAYDMGMPCVSPAMEHQLGLVELYEYLKSSPFIGPFGTIEHPVLVPAVSDQRTVGCSGGVGDDEHAFLWFNCREGFLYRCGECDQIFMLVRVTYGTTWADEQFLYKKEIFAKDPDVDDVFDINLLEGGHRKWNSKDMLRWSIGAQALGTIPTPLDQTEYKRPEVIRD